MVYNHFFVNTFTKDREPFFNKFIAIHKNITSSNYYLSFCFIASFAFVLQRLRAKPIPLKMHKTKGSLREGAGAVGD